jgi:hypothetical protein
LARRELLWRQIGRKESQLVWLDKFDAKEAVFDCGYEARR